LAPGILIAIDSTTGEARVRIICWRDQAYPKLQDPLPSATATNDLRSSAEKTFAIEAGFLASLKAQAKYQSIENIELTISNAEVLEYATADLYEKYDARVSACSQAVKDTEKVGVPVYTVLQALKADVTYHVVTSQSATVGGGLPPGAFDQLKAQLGGTTANKSDLTVTGTGLFWGLLPETIKPQGSSGFGESSVILAPAMTGAERAKLAKRPGSLDPTFLADGKSLADRIAAATTPP
jgi:hypothetical protein